MSNITIKFRDGRPPREFKHEGRAGGSYSKTIRYENGFVIVKDEYGRETIFPSDIIDEINVTPERGWL